MQSMLFVARPQNCIFIISLKHVEDSRGEKAEVIVAGHHWRSVLGKCSYHSPMPIIRDFARRKREWKGSSQWLRNNCANIYLTTAPQFLFTFSYVFYCSLLPVPSLFFPQDFQFGTKKSRSKLNVYFLLLYFTSWHRHYLWHWWIRLTCLSEKEGYAFI